VISILPNDSETIVVAYSADEATQRVFIGLEQSEKRPFGNGFSGTVNRDHFRLSVRLRRQHPFMPLVIGRIESTKKGAIIFIEYSLFPATRLLLLFWTVVIPVVAFTTWLRFENYWILLGGVGILLFVFAIAWANFRIHLKITRELLYQMLT
jgi:hypothetical protein